MLSLSGIPKLESIEGLKNLRTIHSGFFLRWADKITNLSALSNLEKVGVSITIRYNPTLSDFSGLKKCLKDFTGTWDVKGNKINPTVEEVLNAK